MNRKEVENILKKHYSVLRDKYFVKKIGIFGSYVSGKANEKSDVDILVEFYKPIGWDFLELKDYIENILGKRVDLVTEKALKPQIRDKILKEVVYQ